MTVYELMEKYKDKTKYVYVNNVHYDGRKIVNHGYGSHYLGKKDIRHIKDWIVYDYRIVGYFTKVLSIDYMFEPNYLRYKADKEAEQAAYEQALALNKLFDEAQEKLYMQYNMFGGMD